MALILVTSLFTLTLMWVSWRYLRHRDPLLRDVMWMFASVAMLFVIGLVRLLVGKPPPAVLILAIGLLLAKPLFTLRLVSWLRPLRSWWWPTALMGWALTAVPVLTTATRPIPRPVVWPAVAVFFVVEGAAAWLLGVEAHRRGGAARVRLWCAAAGTGMFGAALLVSAAGHAVSARILAVVSGLLYLLAFVTPRGLRRTWAQGATHAVMRRLLAVPANATAQTWQRFTQDATPVLGADAVVVLVPTANRTVQVMGHIPSLNDVRCTTDDLDEVLAADGPIDALAGWSQPPAAAVAFAQAGHTRFVTVAPVNTPGGRGALLMLNRYRSLFAEDASKKTGHGNSKTSRSPFKTIAA